MAGFKNNPAVTVTVRPDGTYYVEKERTAPRKTEIRPVMPPPETQFARDQLGPRRGPSPVAAAITTTLKDLAGIAAVAKAAAPSLGKYGVVAAIGLGVLNAWAESKPRQAPSLQRFQLRRIRRTR